MLGHRELTMEDYTGILKRRFRLILGCGVACLAVGVILSHVLPKKFISQTLVLVEQQKVPENYVKPVVDEDLSARLSSMKEQILSRSRLEPIITKFNLFNTGGANMSDRVEQTRKAISVTQIKPDPNGMTKVMPGFFIAFEANDARTAQQVCGEITSLFVSANLSAREQSAEGTSDFLRQQLDDAKSKLDDEDSKLAEFQRRYVGVLPGQEAGNSSALSALTSRLDAVNESVGHLQDNVAYIQALVSQQSQVAQTADPSSGITIDERKAQLKALMEQKQALQAEYTPDYPDVMALSRKIADMQAEIDRTPVADPTAKTPAPVVTHADTPQLQQLKAQLHAAQQALDDARGEQTLLNKEVKGYESKVDASPEVEEQYKQITRDHDTASAFYNSLLLKMNESSMATALEQRQQGEQFRVMDAPNLPEEPKFPNPYVFAGGGLAGGLLVGLLIAGFLEYKDTSLRTEADVWAFTKLPTLAMLSHIDGLPKPVSRSGRRSKLFSGSNKPLESAGD